MLNLSPLHAFGAENCASYLNLGTKNQSSAQKLVAVILDLKTEDVPSNAYFYLSRNEEQIRQDLNLPSNMRVQYTDEEKILLSSPGLPHLIIERQSSNGDIIFRLPKGLRYSAKLKKN